MHFLCCWTKDHELKGMSKFICTDFLYDLFIVVEEHKKTKVGERESAPSLKWIFIDFQHVTYKQYHVGSSRYFIHTKKAAHLI